MNIDTRAKKIANKCLGRLVDLEYYTPITLVLQSASKASRRAWPEIWSELNTHGRYNGSNDIDLSEAIERSLGSAMANNVKSASLPELMLIHESMSKLTKDISSLMTIFVDHPDYIRRNFSYTSIYRDPWICIAPEYVIEKFREREVFEVAISSKKIALLKWALLQLKTCFRHNPQSGSLDCGSKMSKVVKGYSEIKPNGDSETGYAVLQLALSYSQEHESRAQEQVKLCEKFISEYL